MIEAHRQRYGAYTITFEPPPIPDRRFDWAYVHDDYDGADDSRDRRCGRAASAAECRSEIDEIEEETSA